MSELKPCPFCEGNAQIEPWHSLGTVQTVVGCPNNSCSMKPVERFRTRELAIAAWNRRPDPPDTSDLLAALDGVRRFINCWCSAAYLSEVGNHSPECQNAQAAVAKAKGETP